MHLYRQPIIIFGIVLPVVAMAGLVAVCFMLKSKMVTSFNNKMTNYKRYERSRLDGLEVEAQVTRQRQHVERWSNLLSQETASAVTTSLREIAEHLPNKEYQQKAFERNQSKAGFGSVSAQNSSQITIAFRGTFRTMQRAFLELETKMPQLQLTELKIDPSSTLSSLLNFQVTYTVWEN